jgi:hypothetical protein
MSVLRLRFTLCLLFDDQHTTAQFPEWEQSPKQLIGSGPIEQSTDYKGREQLLGNAHSDTQKENCQGFSHCLGEF